MLTTQLVLGIDARATEIAQRATARVLEDPFWEARFGARALHHSHEDGRYHVAYLVQALMLDAPGLLVEYARWLRDLLVPRGMCTWHLVRHFEVLAQVLADTEDLPESDRAAEMLHGAARALRRDAGPAARIDAVAEDVARETEAALFDADPRWFSARDAATRERCGHELLCRLSYISDAIAREDATMLRAYDEVRSRDGISACPPSAARALARMLAARLDPSARDAVTRILPDALEGGSSA